MLVMLLPLVLFLAILLLVHLLFFIVDLLGNQSSVGGDLDLVVFTVDLDVDFINRGPAFGLFVDDFNRRAIGFARQRLLHGGGTIAQFGFDLILFFVFFQLFLF